MRWRAGTAWPRPSRWRCAPLHRRYDMHGLLARFRSLWRGQRRRDDVEAEIAEEFRHHLELRTEDLIRRGLPPEEAARQARLEFGHIESHRADTRAARGLHVFDEIAFSWLDVKLGGPDAREVPRVVAGVGHRHFGGHCHRRERV